VTICVRRIVYALDVASVPSMTACYYRRAFSRVHTSAATVMP